MERNQGYQAGPAKLADGQAFPITFNDGGPAHLTLPALQQTLCQRAVHAGTYAAATFGPRDCSVCRRMAAVRRLTVVNPGG